MNPLLDVRYWDLLRDVLLDSDVTRSRTVRAWLVPILHRTPLVPITMALYAMSSQRHLLSTELSTASECLSILWPLAATKFSWENLLECFAAIVLFLCNASLDIDDLPSHVHHLAEQVLASYRHACANASNRKKV